MFGLEERSINLRTKKVNDEELLNKVLTNEDIFVFAFGAMIGWARVVMSVERISTAGILGAALSFVAGGIMVIFLGQIYAELTSAMSEGRGVLDFTLLGMGRRLSFIATWTLVLGYFSVIAFEAVALPNVMIHLFPNYLRFRLYSVSGFDVYFTWLAIGIGSSIIVATVNYLGVKVAATAQSFLTIFVALVGAGLIFGTFLNGAAQNLEPLFENGVTGFIAVAAMTPFMYVGFDVIPSVSLEMDIPQKKIGRILILSVFMAIIWYVLV